MEISYSFSYGQPEPPALAEDWMLCPHTQHQLSLDKVLIRSCDRPDALRRLIACLADTATDASITVIDNSRDPENVHWDKEIAARTELECRYFGHQEQQQYIEQLIGLCPEHSRAIRFLLDSGEHENVTTPGLPLNFILLLSMDSRFLLMDDGITLDAHTSPDADDKLQLSFRDVSTPQCHEILLRSHTALSRMKRLIKNSITQVF